MFFFSLFLSVSAYFISNPPISGMQTLHSSHYSIQEDVAANYSGSFRVLLWGKAYLLSVTYRKYLDYPSPMFYPWKLCFISFITSQPHSFRNHVEALEVISDSSCTHAFNWYFLTASHVLGSVELWEEVRHATYGLRQSRATCILSPSCFGGDLLRQWDFKVAVAPSLARYLNRLEHRPQ